MLLIAVLQVRDGTRLQAAAAESSKEDFGCEARGPAVQCGLHWGKCYDPPSLTALLWWTLRELAHKSNICDSVKFQKSSFFSRLINVSGTIREHFFQDSFLHSTKPGEFKNTWVIPSGWRSNSPTWTWNLCSFLNHEPDSFNWRLQYLSS